MKSFFLVLWASLVCIASCGGEAPPPQEPEVNPSDPEVVPEVRELLAPGNLRIAPSEKGLLLSWEDLSVLEEGYLIDKKTLSDGKTASFYLPANSTSWEDQEPGEGETRYTVRSYWHMERSEEAAVSYFRYAAPRLEVLPPAVSAHMVALGVKIVSDGGESVSCGMTVTPGDGSAAKEYLFGKKCRSGEVAYLLAEDLTPGVSYSFLPWAENQAGRSQSQPMTASLLPQPEPVQVAWEDLFPQEALPEGVFIRKGTTEQFGQTVHLWYAETDLTKGTTQLRTTLASALTQPGEYIRQTLSKEGEVLVLVNGGYFASPATSYSYVCDKGQKKASNVSQLSRTDTYTVTRGFLGVDNQGVVAAGWLGGDSFYEKPLPVYDGGPALSLPSNLPTLEGWEPYSAIGGGPLLVKDGAICFDYLTSLQGRYLSNHELFQTDIFAEGLRAPRTAIGSDGKGRIVLLVADGRGSGGSAGLTLDELARVMTGLGCKDVLNLDGGGSSMFLTGQEGNLQNHPSDGRERRVLSFVSIMRINQ